MRLYPADPEVNLYNEGFGDNDLFHRQKTGKDISDLVERIEDPLVIALDGQWGCGKTYFLKRWVGAHELENNGTATTVYFDAFAHDFLDDPLISLTGAIGDQLSKEASGTAWKAIKNAAAKLARPASRVGLALTSAGISEIAAPIANAAFEAGSKELEDAAEAFWKKEDGRRAAMQQLRESLISLTRANQNDDDATKPLVVVVDELDRCRPDYALSLLETIKHFFSVPNVHFILGVNLDALEHSVQARYGVGFDAERYLRRFISLRVTLPEISTDHDRTSLPLKYFRSMAAQMGISNQTIETVEGHLELAQAVNRFTMRDINQLMAGLVLLNSNELDECYGGWHHITYTILMFRSFNPRLEQKALSGTLDLDDIISFYGISASMVKEDDMITYNHKARVISNLWEYVLSNGAQPKDDKRIARSFTRFGDHSNPKFIPRIATEKFLDRFILPEVSD